MNNEPVAWMKTWENQDGELKHTVNIEQIGKNDIPLYTTLQIKELSDEELLNQWHLKDGMDIEDGDLIEFARAILKKANFTCNGFCGKQECKENQDNCKRIKKASEK
jgi:hypothetical protein